MLEILSGLLNIVVLVFAVSSMLSVGFSYTIREIIEPLRNLRGVIKALLANFVLVPLLGYLIIQILPLDRPLEVGLILIACAAGAPFLIKLTIVAGRDVALSTSLLVLLLPLTIIYMPIVVPILIPEISIKAMAIAMPLVMTMLLPLAIGFIIRAYFLLWTARLQPILAKLSSITLLLLVVITFVVNFKAIIGLFGEGIIFAGILLIFGAFGIGYLLGGPDIAKRDVLGLGASQRNIAAATVVAAQGFEDRDTLVVVVFSSLLGLIILFPIAKFLRRREEKKYKTNPDAQEGII
jgi:predicted Na+-dependent transporter